MGDKITKTAELALVRGLPDFLITRIQRGRLQNKCNALIEAVDAELARIPKLADMELVKVQARIERFGLDTRWLGKEKHVVTIVSFLLAMVEESRFRYSEKITESLNQIHDYFERAGDAMTICMVAGGIAQEKWAAELQTPVNKLVSRSA